MNEEIQREEDNRPLVINFFAGPGSGKSTMAAGLFYELKSLGVNCELVTEYAKDKTWEGSPKTIFDNQIYIFGKQHHRQFRLLESVDVIITDSPLMLSVHYANFIYPPQATAFASLVTHTFDTFNNVNFFVERVKKYNPKGRNQTEEQAREFDKDIKLILYDYAMEFQTVPGTQDGLKKVLETVKPLIKV